MRAGIAVVTDSTAYLPDADLRRYPISVVPLQVVIGDRALTEGVEVGTAEVARALAAGERVTTSRPAPALFARRYRELAEAGAAGVVSVHLSGELSGTLEAAVLGAREVADLIPVRVVDSRSLALGLGFPVLAAAGAALAGGDLDVVSAEAVRVAAGTRAWFAVDTLEYLHRGGRIGTAAAWVGTAFAIKPVLGVEDGRLVPVERVRTAGRALGRLVELAAGSADEWAASEAAAGSARQDGVASETDLAREVGAMAGAADRGRPFLDVGVHHVAAPDRAERLAERLRAAVSGIRILRVSEVGAVISAHTGPGLLAVVTAPVPVRAVPAGLEFLA